MRDSSTSGTGAVAARTVGVRQARGPAMITAVDCGHKPRSLTSTRTHSTMHRVVGEDEYVDGGQRIIDSDLRTD